MNHDYERYFSQLKHNEQEVLLAIKSPDDIKTVKYITEWYEDDQCCFGFEINGVQVAYWYCDPVVAGSITYAMDCDRARKDLFEVLQSIINYEANLDLGEEEED